MSKSTLTSVLKETPRPNNGVWAPQQGKVSLRQQWNDSCRACGIFSLSKNTAAQLLAIIYILGGERETFTHNEKLLADIDYIQKEYGFSGGMIPDEYVSQRFKTYAEELNHCGKDYPEWATVLMKENYNINL